MREQALESQPKPDAPIEIRIQAATVLQKHWRGHWTRKLFKLREVERRILIGMDEPIWKTQKIFDDYDRGLEQRRQEKLRKIKEYIKLDTDEKVKLLRVVGPRLFEDITEEIRQWFYKFYTEVKGFDKYPDEIDGGSILIVREETPTPKEWLSQQNKLKLENAKGDAKAKAKKQKEKEKKILKQKLAKEKALEKKEKEQARQREAAGILLLKFEKSKAAELFEEGFEEYKTIWDPKPDHLNPQCKPYMDMITEKRCYEVQLEIRKEVDELMRLELEYLNAALAKDNKKKYKPPKRKKEKKKKKNKKTNDLTSHRTTEELFQELVDNGIIHTYPKVRLSDFKGDVSYNNFEKREMNLNPSPCLGDIRTAVMINCILPLGVNVMLKPKSVLIAGPPRSGKRVLANAIFNETRCVLFDISPPVLAGKYTGKKGMNMLVHLINKMARLLQPSIIFVDGAEKPFYKKIPHEEQENEPRKMGGVLFKNIVKPIKPEDRVLVLGITSEPLKAKKKMEKTFERIIFLSQPDYGSIYLYLRELLMSYRGIDRNFNVSELATMVKNISLSYIKETLEKVLSTSRIAELEYKPFDSHEFLDALFEAPPPLTEKVWAKYEKWFNRTSLARRRDRLIAIQAENADKKKKK
ncbi:hypothetical protein FQR65_LT09373 [Abscondita terminalis]|nr:hypothetical protein FQR65_LT09373 [Abscondita terminalis]